MKRGFEYGLRGEYGSLSRFVGNYHHRASFPDQSLKVFTEMAVVPKGNAVSLCARPTAQEEFYSSPFLLRFRDFAVSQSLKSESNVYPVP
jgi:hypothetical protein